jgi:hypothetical protein
LHEYRVCIGGEGEISEQLDEIHWPLFQFRCIPDRTNARDTFVRALIDPPLLDKAN